MSAECEFGWLIEYADEEPGTYLCVSPKGAIVETKESIKALRFSRKEDAESLIRFMRLMFRNSLGQKFNYRITVNK